MIWDLSQFGEKVALITNEEQITYAQLAASAGSIGNMCPKRSLVFSLCSNTPGSVAGYIGFINSGIVPLLLEAQLDESLIRDLIETYRPSFLWVPADKADDFEYRKVGECLGYVLLATDVEPCNLNDELALLVNTSGSTGSSKLIRLSEENLRSNTQSIIEYLQITPDDRAITSLPMNYVFGLSIINTHLYAGASVVLTEVAFSNKQFWKLFREHEVTSFSGVPFSYEMLDKLKFAKMELPSLRTLTQAGGKLSKAMQQKFGEYAMQTGRKFVVMYGASEATARMSYLPAEKVLEKCGSIGIPIPGGSFQIIAEDGSLIEEANVPGEMVYTGPNVSLGYATCAEDLAKEDENKGVLRTGDIAQRDEDGFLYVVGRMKRFVKLLGKRTSLDEIEQLLKTRFPEADIACGGIDELIYVFTDADGMSAEAQAYLNQLLKINPRMVKVVVLPQIPKNASGKVLYREFQQYYEQK